MKQVEKLIEATDTCARCSLRRATREVEAKGEFIRLCDDCYWGQEPASQDRPCHLGPSSENSPWLEHTG